MKAIISMNKLFLTATLIYFIGIAVFIGILLYDTGYSYGTQSEATNLAATLQSEAVRIAFWQLLTTVGSVIFSAAATYVIIRTLLVTQKNLEITQTSQRPWLVIDEITDLSVEYLPVTSNRVEIMQGFLTAKVKLTNLGNSPAVGFHINAASEAMTLMSATKFDQSQLRNNLYKASNLTPDNGGVVFPGQTIYKTIQIDIDEPKFGFKGAYVIVIMAIYCLDRHDKRYTSVTYYKDTYSQDNSSKYEHAI